MSKPLTNSNELSDALLNTDEKHKQFEKYAHDSFITSKKKTYSNENYMQTCSSSYSILSHKTSPRIIESIALKSGS